MPSIPDYLSGQFHINLNEQQEQAIIAENPYTLLLAVPGSGKTTVLVSRIAHLVLNQEVSPDRILTLTFSREAARDMQSRFRHLFEALIPDIPKFSTIHSFCMSVLQYYARRYRRTMPRLMEGQAARLLREIHMAVNEEYLTEDLLESLRNDISLVRNLMLTKQDLKDFEVSTENFIEIMERYESAKKEQQWMDYDDMLVFALDILKKVPQVRRYMQDRYDYLNIDEAQDSSRIQHEIVRLLSREMNLFVVGDEDQTIYSFRGAYPEALTDFPKTYPDAQVLKIEQNFRSHSDIVGQANEFIKINKNRYLKEMYCENRKTGSVEVVELEDYGKQYAHMIETVRSASGKTAVLYRNNESAVPIAHLLYESRIPFYMKENQGRFFHSLLVQDIVAFLRLAVNPADIDAFGQIYYKWRFSKNHFLVAKQTAHRYHSVFDALIESEEIPFYMKKKLMQYQKELDTIASKRPRQAIDRILDHLGYGEYLEKKSGHGSNAVNYGLKLNILKTLAVTTASVEDFLTLLKQTEQMIAGSEMRDRNAAVTLSSIHSSKGLEFDTVILVDFMDGIIPEQQALEDSDDGDLSALESEARLFYVAVTRAKSRLVIYTSKFCNDEYVIPSRFVRRFLGEEKATEKVPSRFLAPGMDGKRVHHKMFGAGTIVKTGSDDMVTIEFEKAGRKELSYDFCVKQRLIVLAEA